MQHGQGQHSEVIAGRGTTVVVFSEVEGAVPQSIMASVATVIFCVALPLVISYRSATARSAGSSGTSQDIHWRRRLQHTASGLSIASGYKWAITDAWTVVALLGLFCACFLALHRLRCRVKSVNDLYLRLLGPLLRPHEVRGLPGAFWFVLGAAGAVAVFPKDIALQSILHLALGDPAASVAGIKMGDRTRVLPGGKSLAGSLAAFLACATSTLLLFGWCRDEMADEGGDSRGYLHSSVSHDGSGSIVFEGFGACTTRSEISDMHLLIYAVLGGLSGAIGEFLPLGVDDNLSMPLVSGAVFLTLSQCIGGRDPSRMEAQAS